MPLEITIPLDIPDVRLLGTEITDAAEIVITLESTLDGATCHRCGARITEFHGHDAPVRLRHLPILFRTVYVVIRPRRYRCPWCRGGPTTTQRCTWYDAGRPHTKAYDQWLALCLIHSTLTDVARKEGVGEKAVLGALRHLIGAGVNWATLERVDTIGIDEIALRKGRGRFVTIITAKVGERLMVIGVLDTRKKKAVKGFLRSIPEALRATIASVCTDMWRGYTNAVRAVLPDARLVVDRFHVAGHCNEAADRVRRRERERLEAELPKADYAADVKGVMWLYRARRSTLTEADAARLERFFARAPEARRAWELREELRALFEQRMTKAEAGEALAAWRERAMREKAYTTFCGLLGRWMDAIANYFVARETSGFVEGLNTKLKVLKRRCYGLSNLKDFHRRLILDVEGPYAFGMR